MKYLKCHMKTDSWDNCHPPQWVYVWYLWYMCYLWKLVHEDKTLEVSCEKRVCSHPIVSCGLTVTHLRHQTLIQSYEGISNCSGMIGSHLELIHLMRKTVQKPLTMKTSSVTKQMVCGAWFVIVASEMCLCVLSGVFWGHDMTRVTHLHPWACHRLRSLCNLYFVLPLSLSLDCSHLDPTWSLLPLSLVSGGSHRSYPSSPWHHHHLPISGSPPSTGPKPCSAPTIERTPTSTSLFWGSLQVGTMFVWLVGLVC